MSAAILIIDPQKGFTTAGGSLSRAYGHEELTRIRSTVDAIALRLPHIATIATTILIRSQYRSGQFQKCPTDPLYNLCVPETSSDCDIDELIRAFPFDLQFIKTGKSALSSSGFQGWLSSRGGQETSNFFLAGFLAEHCVLQTALDLRNHLPSTSRVIVLKDLIASRASKGESIQNRLLSLQETGIEYLSSEGLSREGSF